MGNLDLSDCLFSDYAWEVTSKIPIDPFANCNRSICHVPCEGAGWPPACPSVVPTCLSGCACVALCPQDVGRRTIVCYETKYCLETRRRFLRRRKTTTLNPEV